MMSVQATNPHTVIICIVFSSQPKDLHNPSLPYNLETVQIRTLKPYTGSRVPYDNI